LLQLAIPKNGTPPPPPPTGPRAPKQLVSGCHVSGTFGELITNPDLAKR